MVDRRKKRKMEEEKKRTETHNPHHLQRELRTAARQPNGPQYKYQRRGPYNNNLQCRNIRSPNMSPSLRP
jgi:hypothetical protein